MDLEAVYKTYKSSGITKASIKKAIEEIKRIIDICDFVKHLSEGKTNDARRSSNSKSSKTGRSERLTLPNIGSVLLVPAGKWTDLTAKMNEAISRLIEAEQELEKVPVDRLRNETRNRLKKIICLVMENQDKPFSSITAHNFCSFEIATLTTLDKLRSLATEFVGFYDYKADPLKLLPLEEEAAGQRNRKTGPEIASR